MKILPYVFYIHEVARCVTYLHSFLVFTLELLILPRLRIEQIGMFKKHSSFFCFIVMIFILIDFYKCFLHPVYISMHGTPRNVGCMAVIGLKIESKR